MALEWLKTILGEGYTDELGTQIAQEIDKGFVARAEHEAELAHLRLDTAVDKALIGAGARNNTAARALLADFLKDAKVAEDGAVKGLSAAIEALAQTEATAFMFDTPGKPPLIHGMKPGEAGDSGQAGGTVNPFAEKTLDLEAQAQLFKTNPDMAKTLAKQAGVKFI